MPAQLPEYARPENNTYAGYRLGYPREGRGAIGGFLRRLGGLVVDWFMALGLANLFFGGDPIAIMLLFVGVTAASVIVLGSSIGHLIFGLHLTRLNGDAPGWWRPIVRQVLLMLVIPAIVWDTDRRGGHDIITGLALRRR